MPHAIEEVGWRLRKLSDVVDNLGQKFATGAPALAIEADLMLADAILADIRACNFQPRLGSIGRC